MEPCWKHDPAPLNRQQRELPNGLPSILVAVSADTRSTTLISEAILSLPDEESFGSDIRKRLDGLFRRADRVHCAAVEVLTRGRLNVTKSEGHSLGTVTVVASLMTKACKTFRAIQLTCESGLGQDAAVLARQLFETAVALAFVLQKDQILRCGMLAAYGDQRQLVLLEEATGISGLATLASPEALERARTKVDGWRPVLGEEVLKSVRRHWSGKSLEWAAGEVSLETGYAVMYRHTSQFAHGSDVTEHFFVSSESDVPTLKLAPSDALLKPVLESSMLLLFDMIGTANDALGLGEESVVARMKAELPQPWQDQL